MERSPEGGEQIEVIDLLCRSEENGDPFRKRSLKKREGGEGGERSNSVNLRENCDKGYQYILKKGKERELRTAGRG